MTADELGEIWDTSEENTVAMFPIFVHESKAKAAPAGDKQGVLLAAAEIRPGPEDTTLLPVAERSTAEAMVQRVLAEHKDVFPEELPDLPKKAREVELRFPITLKDLEGTVPAAERYRAHMTQEHTLAAEKVLKELLALTGFIRPSRSPWGSPMFLAAKPDGGLRMVIDHRALNKPTKRNRYRYRESMSCSTSCKDRNISAKLTFAPDTGRFAWRKRT